MFHDNLVTVGDKGQIVIPAKARKIFELSETAYKPIVNLLALDNLL